MRRKILSAISVLLLLMLLAGCNNDVLKTKEISANIKQTRVVLNDTSAEEEAFGDFFKAYRSGGIVVPGLFEGVIPQGLCYLAKENALLISGYYEDGALPSVLMLIDYETGELMKYVTLRYPDGTVYSSHAGGIASEKEQIYVTSDNEALTLPVSALRNAKSGESVSFVSRFRLQTGGAFANIQNGVLWTGDFTEASDKARKSNQNVFTLETGETFYAYCEGYLLEDGLPSPDKITSDNSGYVPDYFLAIPEQVQGMTVTLSGDLIFSTSYGRKNNSVLYRFKDVLSGEAAGRRTVDGKEVRMYACDAAHLRSAVTAPPMAEGVEYMDSNVWVLFESGAAKYRSGGGKFPLDTLYKAETE